MSKKKKKKKKKKMVVHVQITTIFFFLYFFSKFLLRPIYEPQCQKTYLRTCSPSEESDQPAHSQNLIRILTRRILER